MERVDTALAEGLVSRQLGHPPVTQRSGKHLAATGGEFVDQHYRWQAQLCLAGLDVQLATLAIIGDYIDHCPAVEEMTGYSDHRVQQPSGVAAQVQYQALGFAVSLLLQHSRHGGVKLVIGRVRKPGDPDVGYIALHLPAHSIELDFSPGKRQHDRILASLVL